MLLWLNLMNQAGGDGTLTPAATVSDASRYRSSFRSTDYLSILLAFFVGA